MTKTLGAVRRMTEAGNRVVFDSDGSYVENKKSGVKTKINDDRGEFKMDVWVWEEEQAQSSGELAAVKAEVEKPIFNRLEDLM